MTGAWSTATPSLLRPLPLLPASRWLCLETELTRRGFCMPTTSATLASCDSDDVEQYFNYMGCLAVEGTYDRMYALINGAEWAPAALPV
jgi:hypothetical protein